MTSTELIDLDASTATSGRGGGTLTESREGTASQPCVAELEMVIPVINEERRIGGTLASLTSHLKAASWSSEVIVVDNGSADATVDVVDRTETHEIAVRVLGCRDRGKGAAVRAGILATRADVVGYADADLATPVATIDRAMDLLGEGWDVVIGSRRCEGAEYAVRQPLARRGGGLLFRSLTRHLTPGIADTQCGFKLFRGELARKLFADSTLNGFAFDIEILALARQHDARIVELPIVWSDCEGSTFRGIQDGVRVARDVVTIHRSVKRSS